MRELKPLGPGVLMLGLALTALPCIDALAQSAREPVAARTLPAAGIATILGRHVIDAVGDDVGQLVDVLVDKSGNPIAGVIDVGGFLGVGTRRIAVAWKLLRIATANDEIRIVMDVTYDEAAAAPEYRGPDNTLFVIDRAPR